eukprot:489781_1
MKGGGQRTTKKEKPKWYQAMQTSAPDACLSSTRSFVDVLMNRVISTVKSEKLVDNDCLEALRNGWKKRYKDSLPHNSKIATTTTSFSVPSGEKGNEVAIQWTLPVVSTAGTPAPYLPCPPALMTAGDMYIFRDRQCGGDETSEGGVVSGGQAIMMGTFKRGKSQRPHGRSRCHMVVKECVFRGTGGEVIMPSCRCVFHAATTNVIDSSTISGTEDDSGDDRVVMEKEETSE